MDLPPKVPEKKLEFPILNNLVAFIKDESKIFDENRDAEIKKPGFVSNKKYIEKLQDDIGRSKKSVEELTN